MDLKVCLVAVCLFAFAVTYIQGAGIPKCCVRTKLVSEATLKKVESWKMQQSNGACDINAIVLLVQGRKKPVCADPRLRPYVQRNLRKKRQNNPISAF